RDRTWTPADRQMIVRLRSMTTVACPAEAADSMAWSSKLALSRSITDGAVTTGMPDITSTENPANVGIPAPPAVQASRENRAGGGTLGREPARNPRTARYRASQRYPTDLPLNSCY